MTKQKQSTTLLLLSAALFLLLLEPSTAFQPTPVPWIANRNRLSQLTATPLESDEYNTPTFGNLTVGIIRLDGWGDERTTGTGSTGYVPIRGDVDDARSFEGMPFGLVATIAEGCTWEALKDPNLWQSQSHLVTIRNSVAKAFQTLMEHDADVIIANCGLFMWLHSTGIATPAMDMAMAALDHKPSRPIVALSTLTLLPGYLPIYGLGGVQRQVIDQSGNLSSNAVIAVFTSNEQACVGIFKSTKLLEGTNFFVHTDPPEKKAKGGILVVGLNGDDVVGTGKVDGFEIVNDGTPAFYDVLNPSIEKVAQAVKQQYPNVTMGIVECTEVGAYTDTIRKALEVPVLDPILMASSHMDSFIDHEYEQLSNEDRQKYINEVLAYPVDPVKALPYYIEIAKQYADDAVQQLPKPIRQTVRLVLRSKLADFAAGETQDAGATRDALLRIMKIAQKPKVKRALGLLAAVGLASRKRRGTSPRGLHKFRDAKIMEYLFEASDEDKLEVVSKQVRARLSSGVGLLAGRVKECMVKED